MVMLHQLKLPLNFFMPNVNGFRSSHGIVGVGGFIRNCSGEWIQSFTHHIAYGEVIQVEVCGIFIGLELAADLHIRRLEVGSDSAVAINLMNSKDYEFHSLVTIIGNCCAIMKLFESCHLHHVHHERNVVADILVNDNISHSRGTVFFRSPTRVTDVLDDLA